MVLQQQILTNIWSLLKPGGTLLYATCSILPEENSEQISRFIEQNQDAQLIAITRDNADTDENVIGWQLLPLLILMASVVGAIIGISLMLFKNHQREQGIPFGPYLAIAGWITLLWGDGIWSWYLQKLL